MGTRADFYIGRGQQAEWIGSVAWDGYPGGIECTNEKWPEGEHLFDSTTEQEFRDRLAKYFADRKDVSLPSDGWPWPWDDSGLTDYAYSFDGEVVYGTSGSGWWPAHHEPEETPECAEKVTFPNMKDKQNVQLGSDRSGVIVITRSLARSEPLTSSDNSKELAFAEPLGKSPSSTTSGLEGREPDSRPQSL